MIIVKIDPRWIVEKVKPEITEFKKENRNLSAVIISLGGGFEKKKLKIKSSIGQAELPFPVSLGQSKIPTISKLGLFVNQGYSLQPDTIQLIAETFNSNNNSNKAEIIQKSLNIKSLNDADTAELLDVVKNKHYLKIPINLSNSVSLINRLLHYAVVFAHNTNDEEEFVIYDINDDLDISLLNLANYEKKLLIPRVWKKLMKNGKFGLVSRFRTN